jgi:ABC-type multidrug transport system ATPase subunit
LPDEDFLFPRLSGRENLEYASILKTGNKNWYKKLEEYLIDFGILDMLDEPFSFYSKGMKKKLQIIVSIIGYPEILILDEPHKGLDVLANIKMKAFLKKYIKDGNLVFFSSHILEMVEDICNEVIIIHKGKIVKEIKSLKNHNLTEIYLKSTER